MLKLETKLKIQLQNEWTHLIMLGEENNIKAEQHKKNYARISKILINRYKLLPDIDDFNILYFRAIEDN